MNRGDIYFDPVSLAHATIQGIKILDFHGPVEFVSYQDDGGKMNLVQRSEFERVFQLQTKYVAPPPKPKPLMCDRRIELCGGTCSLVPGHGGACVCDPDESGEEQCSA